MRGDYFGGVWLVGAGALLLTLFLSQGADGQFGSLSWGHPPGGPSSSGGMGMRPPYKSPSGHPPPRPYSPSSSSPGGPGPGPHGHGPPPGHGGHGGPPHGHGGHGHPPARNDYSSDPDPIPPMVDGADSYDSQVIPRKPPILAPNGVVEIYNRVVDDLLRKLEVDLTKKDLDPMNVVIRPTPPGPVRVPGYLQKRPFRRPGAALYRSNAPSTTVQASKSPLTLSKKKTGRSGVLPPETRFSDRPSLLGQGSDEGQGEEPSSPRGAGKISKGPIIQEPLDDDEKELDLSTTPAGSSTTPSSTAAPEELPAINISSEERGSSEEELPFIISKSRSDEFFPEPEEDQDEKPKKKEKKAEPEESLEEVEAEAEIGEEGKDLESLTKQYQAKNNQKRKDEAQVKYKKADKKPVVVDPSEEKDDSPASSVTSEIKGGKDTSKKGGKGKGKKDSPSKKKVSEASEEDEEDDEGDDDPEVRDDHDEEFEDDAEPGTGGGKRPNGGYYPPGGPPAVPAKPNAELTGLSNIKRASDVQVSVDARSAIITARLLVGPINVVIKDSVEALERNVKATIPELEAELLLMERHGVVFLQRFTLDRAYGQDVEISIPKSNKEKKKKTKEPGQPQGQNDLETRRQTKMAAHVSMEVVKLLRSGNLRVNLMRTAQGAMSKLKLPIKKAKKGNKKAGKKAGKKDKKD